MMKMMKMMKMLEFLWGSGSKDTETSPGTTNGSANLSSAAHCCDEKGKFVMDPEAECRRAYDHATEVYLSSFDRTKPADGAILRVEHEAAVQKALSVFTSGAVGAGSVRLNYEKLFHNFLRKTFEEYTKNAFLVADFQSSRVIQTMKLTLRAACEIPDAKVENVFQVLDGLVADYESSCFGPGKCEKLVSFLEHCLEGPIQDLFKKQLDKIESERSALKLRCATNDDNLELLKRQLESIEMHRADLLKRYEDAVSDKKRIVEDYCIHVTILKSKCRTLKESCLSLSKSLQLIKGESTGWKMKYDRILLEQKAEEEKFRAEIAALETRSTAAEGRLVAVREEANSAKEEATEWRQKYEFALAEAEETRDRAAQALEHSNKKAREREDALRAELSDRLVEKDVEIRRLNANNDYAEVQASSLISRLEAAESKAQSLELKNIALNEKTNRLTKILDCTEIRAQSQEKERELLEQQKNHFQEKYLSQCKKFNASERRSKDAENEAEKAIELADIAHAEAAAAHEEKDEARRLAMERLTLIERAQRQVENLEQEKSKLIDEVARLRLCELDATFKADLLERRLEERERQIEESLSRSNEQRSSTVHALDSLLATERPALAEANQEALSIQLQATQNAFVVEIRRLNVNVDHAELQTSSLISRLEAAETKAKSHELENMALKEETNRLTNILDSRETRAQSHGKESELLEQQKNHFQEKYISECESLNEAERSKDAENDAKKAIEPHEEKEKDEARRLAMERLILIEREQRQVQNLERVRSCELVAEASNLAEARSIQQEQTSFRLIEMLRTALGKRLRMATESVQDLDIDDENLRDKKRSKSTPSSGAN